MEKLDLSRYVVSEPTGEAAGDIEAWKAAIANVKAQIEHQRVRQENAELLKEYGPAQLKAYTGHLEGVQEVETLRRDELKRKIEEINKTRKTEQLETGARLAGLEQKWKQQVFENRQIEAACIARESHPDFKRQKATEGDAMQTS